MWLTVMVWLYPSGSEPALGRSRVAVVIQGLSTKSDCG